MFTILLVVVGVLTIVCVFDNCVAITAWFVLL